MLPTRERPAPPDAGAPSADAAPDAPAAAPGTAGQHPRRSRPLPTPRLALVALIASAVALLLPVAAPWGLIVTEGLVVAAGLVDLILAPAPRRIGVERVLPPVVGLGQPAELSWSLWTTTTRPVRIGFSDDLAPSLEAGVRRARLRVEPGRPTRVDTVLRPGRRGRFAVSEIVVRTGGPLGLAGRQAARDRPAELRVYPAFGPRQQAVVTARIRLAGSGERRERTGGGGTDFDQLREYGVDDDARRIDWAATARSSRPIVRTYRTERHQSVVVLFDNGRTMAGRVAGVPRAEHAMDGVLMLTAAASRLGDRLSLTTYDRRIRTTVPPGTGRGQLGRVSEALYELEPALVESDHHRAFAHAMARVRRRSLFCLLTEIGDDSLADRLVPAVRLLGRTHLVLVGAVSDPEVSGWAQATVATPAEAFRRAAAVRDLEHRRRTVARLHAAGATVVDTTPGELAPALTDAYLRAKLRGAL